MILVEGFNSSVYLLPSDIFKRLFVVLGVQACTKGQCEKGGSFPHGGIGEEEEEGEEAKGGLRMRWERDGTKRGRSQNGRSI